MSLYESAEGKQKLWLVVSVLLALWQAWAAREKSLRYTAPLALPQRQTAE